MRTVGLVALPALAQYRRPLRSLGWKVAQQQLPVQPADAQLLGDTDKRQLAQRGQVDRVLRLRGIAVPLQHLLQRPGSAHDRRLFEAACLTRGVFIRCQAIPRGRCLLREALEPGHLLSGRWTADAGEAAAGSAATLVTVLLPIGQSSEKRLAVGSRVSAAAGGLSGRRRSAQLPKS